MSVLAGLALVRGAIDGLAYQHPDDPGLFATAARRLVSTGWADTFADERVQLGPLGVAFHYPVAVAERWLGWDPTFALAILATVCFTMAAIVVFRYLMLENDRTSERVEMFVGLALLLGGPSWVAATSGHPEEGFIALAWLLAGLSAQRGRSVGAGLWIGVAIGLKLVGVLGLPLLLLDRNMRRVLAGGTIAVATGAALYAPFLLFGRVETFAFSWQVRPQSPLAFLVSPDSEFTWSMRVIQTLAVLCVGSALALRWRTGSPGVWLVPLGIFATRFLTDPLDYHYYWLPVGTVLLLGLSTRLHEEFSWHRVWLAGLFYAGTIPFFVLSSLWLAGYVIVVSLVLLATASLTRWENVHLGESPQRV